MARFRINIGLTDVANLTNVPIDAVCLDDVNIHAVQSIVRALLNIPRNMPCPSIIGWAESVKPIK